MALLALSICAAASISAARTGAEATVAVESMTCADIHLQEANLQTVASPPGSQYVLSGTEGRIAVDYAPAPYDIVSQPADRVENRTAADFTARFCTDADWCPFGGAGVYRGFTDYRSLWLDEYYRQLFSGVPGYVRVNPQGWHVLAGGRWTYVPGSGILQLTMLQQSDIVSPGYEAQIGGPLLRGYDHLRTTAGRVSTENVVTPTVRTLIEAGATATTGRRPRFSLQGSVNWSVSETVTVRTVLAGVSERPAFHAVSAALAVERDWKERWFVGLAVRGYRDSGEVIDPLIVSSAAPALRTVQVAASLRWQGERAALRLEGGPYRTRYADLAAGSAQFARLYQDRSWRRLQCTASWKF